MCCIFAHHLPYHKHKNGFNLNFVRFWTFFCMQFYMQSIKFSYEAQFSLLKLLQSCFHPSGSLFDSFVSFSCLRLFSISSICLRHVFDSVKRKAQFLFFDVLHCHLLRIFYSVLQRFSSLKLLPSLLSWRKPLRAFQSSSGWQFSPAFIPPEVFSYPDFSSYLAYDLLHISLQIS